MTLEQNIDLQPNETQILIFTFERIEYPLEEIIRCFTTSPQQAHRITMDVDIPIQVFDNWWIQCFTEPDPHYLWSWFYAPPSHYNYNIMVGDGLIRYGAVTVDAHENYRWLSFNTYYAPNWTLKMSSVPYDLLGTGVGEEVNQPPVASFTYSPEKPMVGGNIIFDASDSDGTIVKFEWNWEDGQSEPVTTPKTSHEFKSPGIYTVTLTVTDNDVLTDTYSQEIDLTLKNGDLLLRRTAGFLSRSLSE